MNIPISSEEMMGAIRKLNSAFDEVICIDDDHYKQKELEKLADSCCRARTGNEALDAIGRHIFADEARNFEVISRDQSKFLEHLLSNTEAFRFWLRS